MNAARLASLCAVTSAVMTSPVLAAAEPGAGTHACAVTIDAGFARPHLIAPAPRGVACDSCAIHVHVVTDNAWLTELGPDTNTVVAEVVAAAEAIVAKPQSEGGLGLDLPITGGTEFQGPQPWTPSNDPITLLGNFRGWTSSVLPVPDEDRDIVILFSGANLDGGATGISFIDSVCSPNAVAIVTYFTPDTDVLGTVLAHMLGHMLGAGHDGIDNDCPSTGYVMSPMIDPFSPATSFSPCSIDEVNAYLASSGGCLAPDPCSSADMALPYAQLDFSDVVQFLTDFSEMNFTADLAAPFGQFDFSDVTTFLAAFGAGCP
ncbi:MAG: M12 family metallo-peptidase [Phycisphaerales bacterium]